MKLKKAVPVSVFLGLATMLLLIGHANATSWQDYSGNHALSFDGTDDYASCSSSVYQTGELTIELWIAPNYTIENGSNSSYGHTYGVLMSYTETWATQGGWALYFNFSDGRLYFTYRWAGPYQGYNTNTFYTNRALWSSDSWYHVAVTYSPTTLSLVFYVNKTIDRTYTWINTQGLVYENAGLKIGGDLANGYMFRGLIDEVRLWNVSRTQSEISGTWDRVLNSTECANPELIGYWRFDEGAGLESKDFSLQGNNALLGVAPYKPTWVIIPEFPSFLILPLFIMATLLTVIVYKKKVQTSSEYRKLAQHHSYRLGDWVQQSFLGLLFRPLLVHTDEPPKFKSRRLAETNHKGPSDPFLEYSAAASSSKRG